MTTSGIDMYTALITHFIPTVLEKRTGNIRLKCISEIFLRFNILRPDSDFSFQWM